MPVIQDMQGPDPEERIEVINTKSNVQRFSVYDHRNVETKYELEPGERAPIQRGYTVKRAENLGSILDMLAPGVVPMDSDAARAFLKGAGKSRADASK